MKRIVLTAASILFMTALSIAQTATPAINQTQQTQEKRINQGIKSGEVTRKEATKLEAEQVQIQREKKIARADGKVTPKEKAKIKKKQKVASKKIHHQKHDAQQHQTK